MALFRHININLFLFVSRTSCSSKLCATFLTHLADDGLWC